MNDTVSDALTRIRNGYLAFKGEVILPYSKLILAILKVLEKEGYIEGFKEEKDAKHFSQIKVNLKYDLEIGSSTNKKPVVSQIERVSKPGLRVYTSSKSLPRVLNGLGIAIISTPKGVMTGRDARKEGLGGEVIAYVW